VDDKPISDNAANRAIHRHDPAANNFAAGASLQNPLRDEHIVSLIWRNGPDPCNSDRSTWMFSDLLDARVRGSCWGWPESEFEGLSQDNARHRRCQKQQSVQTDRRKRWHLRLLTSKLSRERRPSDVSRLERLVGLHRCDARWPSLAFPFERHLLPPTWPRSDNGCHVYVA